MAVRVTPDTLLRLQTEVNNVNAELGEMQAKIQQGTLVELDRLEASTTGRAHRLREQLLTAPARHAAVIAASEGLDAGKLNLALVRFIRHTLHRIAAGPS
jgi:hypothetical protein